MNLDLTDDFLVDAVDLLQRIPDRGELVSAEFSDEVDAFLCDYFTIRSNEDGVCIEDLGGSCSLGCCPTEDSDPGDCCDSCSCDSICLQEDGYGPGV